MKTMTATMSARSNQNQVTEEELEDILGDQGQLDHPNLDEESNPSDSDSNSNGDDGYEYEDMPDLDRPDVDVNDVDDGENVVGIEDLRQVTPERETMARNENVPGGLISPGWSDVSNVSTPPRTPEQVEDDPGPDTVDRVFGDVQEILDEGQDLTGFRNEDFESEEVMGQQTRRSERVSTVPQNLTYDSDYQQQGYQRKEVSFDMNDYEGITEYLDRNWKDLELSHHMFDENDMNVINQSIQVMKKL